MALWKKTYLYTGNMIGLKFISLKVIPREGKYYKVLYDTTGPPACMSKIQVSSSIFKQILKKVF